MRQELLVDHVDEVGGGVAAVLSEVYRQMGVRDGQQELLG